MPAVQLTDQLIEHGPSDLASYRSPLIGIADDVIDTPAFHDIFRTAVVEAHQTIFERHGARALLELGESLKLLAQGAKRSNAAVADQLPDAAGSLLVNLSPSVRALNLWQYGRDNDWIDDAAMALTVLAFGGAVLLDRRRRVVHAIGVGAVAAGIAVVLLTEAIPPIVAGVVDDPSISDAIHDGTASFIADLRALGLWTIPFGLILAAAAARPSSRTRPPASERSRTRSAAASRLMPREHCRSRQVWARSSSACCSSWRARSW